MARTPITDSVPKMKVDATTAPGVSNDSSEGYSVGSLWVDTVGNEAYRCVDDTVGAAIWVNTTLTTAELASVALSGSVDDLSESGTKKVMTSTERTKISFISVTQAVDLDQMEIDIATNNTKVGVTTEISKVIEDTSPQLGGDLDVNGHKIVSTSNGNIEIAPNGTGDFFVNTNQLYVDTSSGNTGVGTTTPQGKLTVYNAASGATANINADDLVIESATNAGISILGDGNEVQYLMFGDAANSAIGRVVYDHNSDFMSLWTNAGERLRIDSSGNMGIGTTAPAENLHIADTGNVRIVLQDTGVNASGENWDIQSSGGAFAIRQSTEAAGAYSNVVERLSITSSGNVGIGTTNPAYKADINGALSLRAMTAPADQTIQSVVLYQDSTTSDFMCKIRDGATVKTVTIIDYSLA